MFRNHHAHLLCSPLLILLAAGPIRSADRVGDASSGKAPLAGDMTLFPMDDHELPWRENLKLTLQAPEKYAGNPVMRAGPIEGVDGYGTLLYGTVIKEGNKFRMWYLAAPRADSRIPEDLELIQQGWRPVAYAESTDGIHWSRPNLGLVEFRGNKNNNLVRVEPWDKPYSHSTDFIAVWHEPEDPDPGRRYKMAFITFDKLRKSGVTATSVSSDGLRWRLLNNEPIQQGHFENTGLIKFDGLYYLSGQNIPPFDGSLPDGNGAGRVMKIFFSPDFKHWSNGRALAWYRDGYVTKPEGHGDEDHMGAGLWNRGNVVLGLYGRWYGDTIHAQPQSHVAGLKMDLGLVVSNDAIHYREPVRNFIMVHHGPPDAWDSESILEANAFANTDTQTLIWYSHWYTSRPGHIPPLPAELDEANAKKADSVGLLTMPRDRFGYFSKLLPVSQERNKSLDKKIEASCMSRSLRLSRPSQMFVNIDDVTANSGLEIALVDDAERPLPGYTAKLNTCSLKAGVQWNGKRTLPVNAPFRVKVTWPAGVDNGKLYGIYIERQ